MIGVGHAVVCHGVAVVQEIQGVVWYLKVVGSIPGWLYKKALACRKRVCMIVSMRHVKC